MKIRTACATFRYTFIVENSLDSLPFLVIRVISNLWMIIKHIFNIYRPYKVQNRSCFSHIISDWNFQFQITVLLAVRHYCTAASVAAPYHHRHRARGYSITTTINPIVVKVCPVVHTVVSSHFWQWYYAATAIAIHPQRNNFSSILPLIKNRFTS